MNRTEYATFIAALRQATSSAGYVSQSRVRPLIQGIPASHHKRLYRRAVSAGVIRVYGFEPSATRTPQQTYLWSAA